MSLNRMSSLWARTALLWFLAAVLFGMYLGMTQQFGASSAHAHTGLLGWVSSALFAFLYALTGGRGDLPKLATAHWAVHNLGALTMVVSLFLYLTGHEGAEVFIPLGGVLVILGVVWLVATMWPRLRAE